jgi:hypothetical protein
MNNVDKIPPSRTGWPEWENFRPLGDVYNGNFSGIYTRRANFAGTLSTGKVRYQFWQKWVGPHFGHFFTNSSGHPDREKDWDSPNNLQHEIALQYHSVYT